MIPNISQNGCQHPSWMHEQIVYKTLRKISKSGANQSYTPVGFWNCQEEARSSSGDSRSRFPIANHHHHTSKHPANHWKAKPWKPWPLTSHAFEALAGTVRICWSKCLRQGSALGLGEVQFFRQGVCGFAKIAPIAKIYKIYKMWIMEIWYISKIK